jgi:hypothetical protein
MKTVSEITVTKVDGNISPVGSPKLLIESHWNNNDLVDIKYKDYPSITIPARELRKAIENCTNN